MARKRGLRMYVPDGDIAGVNEDGLVQARGVRAVMVEKVRSLRRGGARTAVERQSDIAHRNFGIPVYDQNAAQAHLAELLHRGRSQQP